MLFQCIINNYSFLPMPLAFLFWGEQGLALLIFSTIDSEIAFWTLGGLQPQR
jgi:predicted permease